MKYNSTDTIKITQEQSRNLVRSGFRCLKNLKEQWELSPASHKADLRLNFDRIKNFDHDRFIRRLKELQSSSDFASESGEPRLHVLIKHEFSKRTGSEHYHALVRDNKSGNAEYWFRWLVLNALAPRKNQPLQCGQINLKFELIRQKDSEGLLIYFTKCTEKWARKCLPLEKGKRAFFSIGTFFTAKTAELQASYRKKYTEKSRIKTLSRSPEVITAICDGMIVAGKSIDHFIRNGWDLSRYYWNSPYIKSLDIGANKHTKSSPDQPSFAATPTSDKPRQRPKFKPRPPDHVIGVSI